MRFVRDLSNKKIRGVGIVFFAMMMLAACGGEQSRSLNQATADWQLSSPKEYESRLEQMTEQQPLQPADPKFIEHVAGLISIYNRQNHMNLKTQQAFLEAIGCSEGAALTIVDIDHNGKLDSVFTYSGSGSGGYAGIGAMLTLNQKGKLSDVLLSEELLSENMASTQVSIRSLTGMNYLYFLDVEGFDRYFLIQGDVTREVFNDKSLTENGHLDTPEAEAEKERIYDLYHIEDRVAALADKPIDFSVTGLPTEDILIRLYQLKDYVEKDQKSAVSKLVKYPLGYKDKDGRYAKLYTPEDFVQIYDAIVTPDVKKVILEADETSLFVSYRGVMIGSGEVWISETVVIHAP